MEIASLFQEASKSYHDSPNALHPRAMNIPYDGLEEKAGVGGMVGAYRQTKLSSGEGV